MESQCFEKDQLIAELELKGSIIRKDFEAQIKSLERQFAEKDQLNAEFVAMGRDREAELEAQIKGLKGRCYEKNQLIAKLEEEKKGLTSAIFNLNAASQSTLDLNLGTLQALFQSLGQALKI